MQQGFGKAKDFEFHHVLFHNKAWNSNPDAARLRNNHGILIPMYVGPHDELHNVVHYVPLLDSYHAYEVDKQFDRSIQSDPLGNIQRLLEAMRYVLDTDQYVRNNDISRGVGELAILAVQIQIPFIEDGLYRNAIPTKVKRRKIDRRRGGYTY